MRIRIRVLAALLAFAAAAPAAAQSPAGEWRGVLQAGGQEFRVVLRVTADTAGALMGTFDSVDQGAMGLPVAGLTFAAGTLRFRLPQVQGSYEGTMDAGGAAIQGTWSQGGAALPLRLVRSAPGAARVATPGELDGAWSGTVAAAGSPPVRLILNVTTYADGLSGTMDVPDQGARGVPVTALHREGNEIRLQMRQVRATFAGTLDAARGTISGVWRQGGAETPLVLRKAAAGAQ